MFELKYLIQNDILLSKTFEFQMIHFISIKSTLHIKGKNKYNDILPILVLNKNTL